MIKLKKIWPFLFSFFSIFILAVYVIYISSVAPQRPSAWPQVVTYRAHLDHKAFFSEPIDNPEKVTAKCLECHKDAANQMIHTTHWNWKDKSHGLGKINLINNFCIGISGNWNSCTKCHAGYGWKDEKFDFKDTKKVDCLVCHEWSGQYVKGAAGQPVPNTNLQVVAQSVGYPKRENCSTCHAYGGGGLGVKHGDLDSSLINPAESLDVHMGKFNFQCIDCHKTEQHDIQGRAYSVGVDHKGGFDCAQCHQQHSHQDTRLNAHMNTVACQTCHIPTFARKQATKTEWDWSKAGDSTRKDDQHHYLKIKGEFVYDANITPTYKWFNMTVKRYLAGDKINPAEMTELNYPQGSIKDPTAKIWPFKVHDAKQIYDAKYNYLMQPVTSGEGGYWQEFNWDKALKLSVSHANLEYSGKYDFAPTRMYWPISHMVVPKQKSLSCNDCHGKSQTRFQWKELGYKGDPMDYGGRGKLILEKDKVEK